ncbi:hypothetical protein U1Q18_004280 [Sarracenia purpurea var. burkii]
MASRPESPPVIASQRPETEGRKMVMPNKWELLGGFSENGSEETKEDWLKEEMEMGMVALKYWVDAIIESENAEKSVRESQC